MGGGKELGCGAVEGEPSHTGSGSGGLGGGTVLLAVVVVGAGGCVGAVVDQAQNSGATVIKEFERFANDCGAGKAASDHEKRSVNFRSERGGVVSGEHRATVD